MPTALAGVSSKTARRRVATRRASDFAQYPVRILAGIMVRVRSSRALASATHTESRRGMYKVAYSAADAQFGCQELIADRGARLKGRLLHPHPPGDTNHVRVVRPGGFRHRAGALCQSIIVSQRPHRSSKRTPSRAKCAYEVSRVQAITSAGLGPQVRSRSASTAASLISGCLVAVSSVNCRSFESPRMCASASARLGSCSSSR